MSRRNARRIHTALIAAFLCFAAAWAAERNPARWEKEIRAFEEADRENPPPKGAVLFVGSSSIRLWETLEEDFPELTVIKRGFGGAHLPDVTAYADRFIIPHKPSKIVLYAGENDIARGASPEMVVRAFREFVATVREALPRSDVYFISMKPSPSRWYLSPQMTEANRAIRRYCVFRRNLHYIDVWSPMLTPSGQPDPTLFTRDNLHLNEIGYALWARVVGEALRN